MTGEALERVLDNPLVRERINRPRKISFAFDMPYVGGYSVNGDTIYGDRHLPEELELELDGQKKTVRPAEFLFDHLGHEPVEWSVMDGLGWSYNSAHAGPATGSERRKVIARLGPGWWTPWQREIGKYVKADQRERIEKMPKDYDLRPILYPPVNRALLAHVQKAMGKERKYTKAETHYSDTRGTRSQHCGKDREWGNGCRYFEHPAACELVRGYIEARGLCDEYEPYEAKA